jgi:hypothetical protein
VSTLLLSFYYAPTPATGTSAAQKGGGDLELFSGVVAKLQRGIPYYEAMGAELRAHEFPSASVMNWRTPLHLSTIAVLTIDAATVLFGILGFSVLFAGIWSMAPRGGDARAWGIFCVAGATVPIVLARPSPVLFAEAWCGLFIGLSVAAYAKQRWIVAALCGVFAMFVRELAAPYVLLCGATAMVARRRQESLVWLLGGAAYLVYYVVHASFAHAAMRAGDFSHAESWVQWQGLPFVLSTAKWYGWARIAPAVAVPFVLTSGMTTALAPGAPVQLRLGIVAYILTFSIVGQPFNSYWGMVTAPLWAFGLAYSLGGLRWLVNSPGRRPDRVPRRSKGIEILGAGAA